MGLFEAGGKVSRGKRVDKGGDKWEDVWRRD